MKKRLVAIVLSVVVMATACGSGSDDTSGASQDVGGPIAATCAIGNPNCVDTAFGHEGDPPADTPNTVVPGELNGVGLDGVPIDGGLTVPEALSTDATGMVAVKGFVVASADSVKLCELLAESFPPQCGGASLTLDVTNVADLRVLEPVPYTDAQGVTWTDSFVTLFGNVVNGAFVVA